MSGPDTELVMHLHATWVEARTRALPGVRLRRTGPAASIWDPLWTELAADIESQAEHEGADPRAVWARVLAAFFVDGRARGAAFNPKFIRGGLESYLQPPPEEHGHARVCRLLGDAYAERYREATGDPWLARDANARAIERVAAWCAAAQPIELRVHDVLRGAFADAWLAERRWPWAAIAKDPAKWAQAGRERREKAERAERDARAARARAEAERAREAQLDAEAEEPGESVRDWLKQIRSGR